MKPSTLFAAAALAVVTAQSPAFADTSRWTFDAAHTISAFEIRHIFTKVQGRFGETAGTIVFDDKDWSKSSVEATIQAKSISTNHEKRDNHLRSADFFDVEKFPTITFKSTKVTPGPNKTFKIEGDLTMKGVTKPVVLDATFLGLGDFGIGGNKMARKSGWEARTKVNRKDFGIVWNRTLDAGGTLLGDDVDITLSIEADEAAAAAGSN